jgi:hypothetical protein
MLFACLPQAGAMRYAIWTGPTFLWMILYTKLKEPVAFSHFL